MILLCTSTVDDAGQLDRLNSVYSQGNAVIAMFPGNACRGVDSDSVPRMQFEDGWGFHYERNHAHCFNATPDRTGLITLVGELLEEAKLPCRELGPHVRTQRVGPYRLAFKYGRRSVDLDKHLGDRLEFHHDTLLLIGSRSLK